MIMKNLLQLTSVHIWILPLMSLQKDVVYLSNSGPVIKGSEIMFKAQVLDAASHPIQDEKFFEYHWLNTADYLTTTTKGYENTTLKSCYNWFIPARKYKMTVRVCDLRNNKRCKFIGEAESPFEITEDLNGNLNVSQELKYRNPNSSEVFSTQKPVRLHLNLTDKFKVKPAMDFTWYIDGNLSLVTNTPETDLAISDSGEHVIKVEAKAMEEVPVCDDILDTEDVTGEFTETVILKDPVNVNISGRTVVHTTDPVVINVTLNGSEPFTVCLQSNSTGGLECIDDWCCQEVTNSTHCNITAGPQPEGNHTFIISIANDVSLVFRQHNVTVRVPPRKHTYSSAAAIVLPVIGGLVAVCFLLALTIYVMNVRKKKYVEVADFNFHPSILSTGRQTNNFVTNIKYTFQRMFGRNNYDRMHRHACYAPVPSGSYGSIEETSRKQELYETL